MLISILMFALLRTPLINFKIDDTWIWKKVKILVSCIFRELQAKGQGLSWKSEGRALESIHIKQLIVSFDLRAGQNFPPQVFLEQPLSNS